MSDASADMSADGRAASHDRSAPPSPQAADRAARPHRGGRADRTGRPPRIDRRIPLAGGLLLVAWAGFLVVTAIARPDPYAGAWILALETAFAGRAASIAHGTADGYAWWYLVFHVGLQDTWLVLLAWPAIVAGERTAARLPWLGRPIRTLHRIAVRHRHRAAAVGVPGLFLLVFFPFWSTGALVGATLGHLVGLSTRAVLAVTIAGHLASVAALLALFEVVTGLTEAIDPRLPWVIVGGLLLLALGGPLVSSLRRGGGGAAGDAGPTAASQTDPEATEAGGRSDSGPPADLGGSS